MEYRLAKFVTVFCFSLVIVSGICLILRGITGWGITFVFLGVLGMVAILWELREVQKEYERRKKIVGGDEVKYKKVIKEDKAIVLYDTDPHRPTHPMGDLYDEFPCAAFGIEVEKKKKGIRRRTIEKYYIYMRAYTIFGDSRQRVEIDEATAKKLMGNKKEKFVELWKTFKQNEKERVKDLRDMF